MSTSAGAIDRILAAAPTPDVRLAWFGALLTKESGTKIVIVGGSAIEIHLSARAYVSEDVDIVGSRSAIRSTLRRWGFREVAGRSQRLYWVKPRLALIDLVGPRERSGLPPVRVETPHGPVLVSAVEPLILRRLSRANREGVKGFRSQAEQLARGRDLDWEYLEAVARFEGLSEELQRLRKAILKDRSPPRRAGEARSPVRSRARPRSHQGP